MANRAAPVYSPAQTWRTMRLCLEALEARTHQEPVQPTLTFEEAVVAEMAHAFGILLQKHHMRGVDNLKQQGIFGLVSRMANDKMARLLREAKMITMRQWCTELNLDEPNWQIRNMEGQGPGDSFADDLYDVENYSILARLLMSGQLDLPDGRY